MNGRRILIASLVLGVLVLVAHQQHPFQPRDSQSELKCSACLVHGKVIVPATTVAVLLAESNDPITPSLRRSVARVAPATAGSRAPPSA